MDSLDDLAKQIADIKEEGLSFEDKQLSWDNEEDVKDVVDALNNTKIVHYLKLEGNTLGTPAAEAIGKALQKHPEFRKALWRNMFTRRLKTEIPKSLSHLGNGLQVANAQLTVLDLSDNALGPNGMVGLEGLLRSRVCYTLQELRLNNCGLGIEGGRMLSKALLDCHQSSVAAGTPLKLKVFVTGRNRLENEGAMAIAKIFSTIKTLEEIAMPQNSIYHGGVKALAAGFGQCKNLQILDLNDNTVTDTGATYIVDALTDTPHLRELNLGDCLLKTDGAYILADALEQHHNMLERVILSYNEIGADGGIVLAQAFQKKPHLKILNINGNEFGEDGRGRILEIMQKSNNPDALETMDEDQGEDDDDDEEEDEHDYDDDDDDDEGDVDEGEEEEGVYSTEPDNDATDDAEEDDEAAYVTTEAFHTKFLNDSTLSNVSGNSSVSNNIPQATDTRCPTEIFCLSQKPCTLSQFEALPGDKHITLKDYVNLFDGDNFLLVLIFTTLKCANLSQNSEEARNVAKALYRDVFEYAVKIKQERRVVNYLLKQLGLLRSEQKFKCVYNQAHCRSALQDALKEYKMPSEYMANVLKVFLEDAAATTQ